MKLHLNSFIQHFEFPSGDSGEYARVAPKTNNQNDSGFGSCATGMSVAAKGAGEKRGGLCVWWGFGSTYRPWDKGGVRLKEVKR